LEKKKVLVSGCFDLIHAGHIAFFKQASAYGDVYASLGSDDNIRRLKGRPPVFSQDERLAIVRSLRTVTDAFVGTGEGLLDFEPELDRIKPDRFVVNADGHAPEKEALCRSRGIEYIVLERVPDPGLPARSSSGIKLQLRFPYRLCLAGGWMDQPWMSEIHAGSVVVAQIMPTVPFALRSGLATSSRAVALSLWGDRYPEGDPIENARRLFGAENPPGTQAIAGSQDHLGLLVPGISRLYYGGEYWPVKIDNTRDSAVCEWLSKVLHLIPLKPRLEGYNPLDRTNLRQDWIKDLGAAGALCWKSLLARDIRGLGQSMTQTMSSWRNLLPLTVPDWVIQEAHSYERYPGCVPTGCGGGYLMVASEDDVPGSIPIRVRF
jgi:cytidyltransferase-like protein